MLVDFSLVNRYKDVVIPKIVYSKCLGYSLLWILKLYYVQHYHIASEQFPGHYRIWLNRLFLAPPAGRQRSFSNADSSVVRRRPSSSVVCRQLSLKILFSQERPNNFCSFFWCTASLACLGRYPCTVKIWIRLNHPKGHLKSQKGQIWLLFYLAAIFSKTVR